MSILTPCHWVRSQRRSSPSTDSTYRRSSEQDEVTVISRQNGTARRACSPEEHFHSQINLFSVSKRKQGNKVQLSRTAHLIPNKMKTTDRRTFMRCPQSSARSWSWSQAAHFRLAWSFPVFICTLTAFKKKKTTESFLQQRFRWHRNADN